MGTEAMTALPSYEESVQQYYTRIFGYILRWTHDRQLAEDLTQETFLRAYRAYARLAPESNIDHWLIKVAGSAIQTHFHRKANRSTQRVSLEQLIEETGDTFQAPLPDVGDTCIDRMIFQTAFRQLPRQYQETLTLIAHGHSYQEMVVIQGSTIGAVASRVRHARHMFHKVLQKVEQEPHAQGMRSEDSSRKQAAKSDRTRRRRGRDRIHREPTVKARQRDAGTQASSTVRSATFVAFSGPSATC